MNKNYLVKLIAVVILTVYIGIANAGPIEECSEYSALGVPGQRGELLCRKGFLLLHSPEHKIPMWVIEHMTLEKSKGAVSRYDKFKADPDLVKGKRAELSDYSNSGYDRGHMAPAADMKWDQQAMIECFYLSNMVPQVGKNMNRGIWKELEERIRTWVINRGSVYIFTGTLYDNTSKVIGENKVTVPTHLYKIVYDPQNQDSIAFLIPNEEITGNDLLNYITTIREIEEKTGLDFLSDVEKVIQDKVETKKAHKLW